MQSSATRAHTAYQRAEKQEQPEASTDPLQSDAYQAILYSSLPEPEKEPARLAQEILTMLVGGSATTAKVMTRTTYHLTSEPAMLARLREELKTIMPDPFVTPAMEQLEQLSYLVSLPISNFRHDLERDVRFLRSLQLQWGLSPLKIGRGLTIYRRPSSKNRYGLRQRCGRDCR